MSHTAQVHATCVALDGRGVLLRGAPGSGKSDLAIRLIVEAGARLVADDRTELERADDGLVARAPAAIAGRIEARGVGILEMPAASSAPLALLVDLSATPERLPDPPAETLLGVRLPRVEIDPRESGAVAKLRLALGAGGARILPLDDQG